VAKTLETIWAMSKAGDAASHFLSFQQYLHATQMLLSWLLLGQSAPIA